MTTANQTPDATPDLRVVVPFLLNDAQVKAITESAAPSDHKRFFHALWEFQEKPREWTQENLTALRNLKTLAEKNLDQPQ